ncbi:MAG: DUF512 domain-containing protein [Actinobacteria bacterium]|nr:DUF512 domain-containing protein [Actinomycetota bacterium]
MSETIDKAPHVVAVDEDSAARRHGLQVGDVIVSVNGVVPRDVIEWQRLVDSDELSITLTRSGIEMDVEVARVPGEPFGVTVSSAVFDRIHTCDNHCEFCFIYQLPKGMRRSLYTKDDDYRLSFLYGNFTTLTRFTEADLERVIDEKLSPLYVSIHAAEPRKRAAMLRNERGGTSLRWLHQLIDAGVEVHAQIVLCPGVNDGDVLDDTLHRLLEDFANLSTVAIVPLGLSKHNTEPRMRVHSREEARAAIDLIDAWSARFMSVLGRPVVFAADELYLRAGRELPGLTAYGEFEMLEDGIGLGRSFIEGFKGNRDDTRHHDGGFFGSVDSTAYVRALNPAADTSLRQSHAVPVSLSAKRSQDVRSLAIVTGELGAAVIGPLLRSIDDDRISLVTVPNRFFGGNTAVAGLMTFEDIMETLGEGDRNTRYLLPDVCLNGERFLDGHTVEELSRVHNVEVMPTSGSALRARIQQFTGAPS